MLSNLDRKSGNAVAKNLRSNPRTIQIPILLLASTKDSSDGKRLRSLGMQGVVRKPFDSSNLKKSIEMALRKRKKAPRKQRKKGLASINVFDDELLDLISSERTWRKMATDRDELAVAARQLAPVEQSHTPTADNAGIQVEPEIVDSSSTSLGSTRTKPSRIQWVLTAAVSVLLLLFPHVFGLINADIIVGFSITAVFAVSLNLLCYTGLYSFGHAMFYGIGAYTTALGLFHIEGLPFFASVIMGGAVAALSGLVISPLLVRVSGIYFTLLTIALNYLAYVLCIKLTRITRAENGFAGFSIPAVTVPGIGAFDLTHKLNFYYFAVVAACVCIFLMWYLTKTSFFSILLGIRDNQERVEHLGFQVPVTKAVIFVLSGFFAGIAGSLIALWLNVIDPNTVLHPLNASIPILLVVLVGGMGTFAGPLIGAGIFLLMDELIVHTGGRASSIIGLITVVYLLYSPKYAPWGIMGVYSKLREKWFSRTSISFFSRKSLSA